MLLLAPRTQVSPLALVSLVLRTSLQKPARHVARLLLRADAAVVAIREVTAPQERSGPSRRRLRSLPLCRRTSGDAKRTSCSRFRTQVFNDDLADAFHRWCPGLMPAMDEQPLTA
jgi:hypothetical protein